MIGFWLGLALGLCLGVALVVVALAAWIVRSSRDSEAWQR